MNHSVNKTNRKISGNQIAIIGVIATILGIIITLIFKVTNCLKLQIELSLIFTFFAFICYFRLKQKYYNNQNNKEINLKKYFLISLIVIILYYSVPFLYNYCVNIINLPTEFSYDVFLIGIISSFIIGLFTYRLLLCFFRRYFFVLFKFSFLEYFLDLIYGHRRYKIVRDFGAYCINGKHMLNRAVAKVKNIYTNSIRSVQLPSQVITDQKNFQGYLRTTYTMIFSRHWEYKRLVYISLDPTDGYFQLKNAFQLAFLFMRTILLEYYFSRCDSMSFREINKTHKLKTPEEYNFGIAHELISKRKVDFESMTRNLKRTIISFTSKKSEFLELAMKLDLHLPPGDEFSVAFTENSIFQGFIRVSNQNIINDKKSSDIKKYFEDIFDKNFELGEQVLMSEVLNTLNINNILNQDDHSDDLLALWKSNNIDENLFDYLFDKLLKEDSNIAGLKSEIKECCGNNFIK